MNEWMNVICLVVLLTHPYDISFVETDEKKQEEYHEFNLWKTHPAGSLCDSVKRTRTHTWDKQGNATLCVRDGPSCAVLRWFWERNYVSPEARGGRSRIVKSGCLRAFAEVARIPQNCNWVCGLAAAARSRGRPPMSTDLLPWQVCARLCSVYSRGPRLIFQWPQSLERSLSARPKQELIRAPWSKCIPFLNQWISYLW